MQFGLIFRNYQIVHRAYPQEKVDLQSQICQLDKLIEDLNDKIEEFNAKEKSWKETVSETNAAVEIETKQCIHDMKGFCKKRRNCPFFHASEICKQFVVIGYCRKSGCRKRQTSTCFNFFQSKCQWDKQCKYLHQEEMVAIIVEYEDDVTDNATEVIGDEMRTETPSMICNVQIVKMTLSVCNAS